jgi:hypothetical protein
MAEIVTHAFDADAPVVGVENCELAYVDGFKGVAVENNVAKIVYFQNVLDPNNNKLIRRARMIMTCPLPVLVQIRDVLNQVLTDMEQKGILVIDTVEPKKSKDK